MLILLQYLFKTLLIPTLFFITTITKCSEQEIALHEPEDVLARTEQPSTVFVHGTLFCFSWLVRLFDCPLGLVSANENIKGFVIGKIPHILGKSNPSMFPLDKFYLWGWHGELSFDARMNSSHELYHDLKSLSGKKTLIGQSHGCNVALNLAKIAQEHHDSQFLIDRLILLAGPVQEVTSHLVTASTFKKVFSLYSSADLIQVMDPQGLYPQTRKRSVKPKLFSEKIFKPAPNLVQAEIVINNAGISHFDFVTEKFVKHLPDIIELLDEVSKSSSDYHNFHYKVNIPLTGKPHLVVTQDQQANP